MLGIVVAIAGLLAALALLLFAGLVGGGIAQVAGRTPPPPLQPCGGAVVWGNGGYLCDGPPAADGSFERCTAVYVLGIGGWTCNRVYPPVRP
jgi:hypothetical protein